MANSLSCLSYLCICICWIYLPKKPEKVRCTGEKHLYWNHTYTHRFINVWKKVNRGIKKHDVTSLPNNTRCQGLASQFSFLLEEKKKIGDSESSKFLFSVMFSSYPRELFTLFGYPFMQEWISVIMVSKSAPRVRLKWLCQPELPKPFSNWTHLASTCKVL